MFMARSRRATFSGERSVPNLMFGRYRKTAPRNGVRIGPPHAAVKLGTEMPTYAEIAAARLRAMVAVVGLCD
jgi:hypothetical protein